MTNFFDPLSNKESIIWTLEQGVAVARLLEPLFLTQGCHCALGGSVLQKGQSRKDLDIIVYPRNTDKGYSVDKTLQALASCGFLAKEIRDHSDYKDGKLIWHMQYQGKRIDIFFL